MTIKAILLDKNDNKGPFSNTAPLSNCNYHPYLRQTTKKMLTILLALNLWDRKGIYTILA